LALKTTVKLIIFFVIFSFSFYTSNTQQNTPTELPTCMAGIKLDDYRVYLETHPPLDRLYKWGDEGFFLVTAEDIERIKKSGIKITRQKNLHTSIPALDRRKGDVNGLYHNYRETEALLMYLETRFPGIVDVFSIGKSIEGREIYVIKISDNVQVDEEEPNIFMVGCHHAREWISVEVPLLFARYMVEHYGDNPEVQRAVNGSQVYILPILNPDGLEFTIHVYRWWRKNRRYNGDLSWGIDLNRNYGYQWGYDDSGSSPNPAGNTYRGPSPFSEPESNALRQFYLAHPPSGTLSYHNYSQNISYPWGFANLATPDEAEMNQIAQEMSQRIFQVNGSYYAYGRTPELLYVTNGDHDDWVYGTFAVPAFTYELPPVDYLHGGFINSEDEIDPIFSENLPAMLYFVNYFINDNGEGILPRRHEGTKIHQERNFLYKKP